MYTYKTEILKVGTKFWSDRLSSFMGGNMSGEFGYVRVSCTDQNEERQMIALRENGIQNRNIYMDKMSGKDFNRPEYKKLVKKLRRYQPDFKYRKCLYARCPYQRDTEIFRRRPLKKDKIPGPEVVKMDDV